jgi:hypothetical protein
MTDHSTHDPLIDRTEEQAKASRIAQAANLFDLRRIIGGVFVAYGLLLTILGAFDSQAEIDRAQGVNINLWAGLGMLALGILFLIWVFSRPLSEELREASEDDPSGPTTAAPPRGVDAAALGSEQRRRRSGDYGGRAGGHGPTGHH